MTMRVGAVRYGDHNAFEANLEMGVSGSYAHHAFQVTHGHGVSANEHAAYVGALNADYVSVVPDVGPLARIGVHLRASDNSSAILVRGAVFTGIGRNAEDGSGGLGIEIAGGVDPATEQQVYEASIVMHGRWKID